MSSDAQMRVMNLCKGMKISQVEYRLNILEKHVAAKQLALRCKTAKLNIGE